jgi:RIO-like serine/threonine protein kinase
MEEYFQYIAENLDVQDIHVLRILSNDGANAKYKGMPNAKAFEKSELSEAKYRNVITRLTAMRFVEVNTGSKEHSLFINSYGKKALAIIFDKQ